jgi:DNA polymerase III sliding clamp (beta) subunit (PCNA family)
MARILVKVLPDEGQVYYQVLSAEDDTPTAVCCYWQLPNQAEVIWTSQLVDGQYPDFAKILAQRDGYPISLPLDGPALMRALRQAQALQPQTLRLVLQSETLQVCARNAEGGELVVDCGLATPQSTALDVWFNPKFLTDGVKLAVRPDEQTTLYLKEAHKPGFLVSAGTLQVTYALMPLDPSRQ